MSSSQDQSAVGTGTSGAAAGTPQGPAEETAPAAPAASAAPAVRPRPETPQLSTFPSTMSPGPRRTTRQRGLRRRPRGRARRPERGRARLHRPGGGADAALRRAPTSSKGSRLSSGAPSSCRCRTTPTTSRQPLGMDPHRGRHRRLPGRRRAVHGQDLGPRRRRGLASLSLLLNLVYIPYFPAWSIVVIAIDAFIIWALLTPRRRYARPANKPSRADRDLPHGRYPAPAAAERFTRRG